MPTNINDLYLYTPDEIDQRIYGGIRGEVDRINCLIQGKIASVEDKICLPEDVESLVRKYLLEIIEKAKAEHDLSLSEITLEDFESVLNGTYKY